MTSLDESVREHAWAVITGETGIDEFEQWFVSETVDERTKLVAAIDHLLVERPLIPIDEFLYELRVLLSRVDERPEPRVVLGSSGVTTVGSLTLGTVTVRAALGSAGRPPALAQLTTIR